MVNIYSMVFVTLIRRSVSRIAGLKASSPPPKPSPHPLTDRNQQQDCDEPLGSSATDQDDCDKDTSEKNFRESSAEISMALSLPSIYILFKVAVRRGEGRDHQGEVVNHSIIAKVSS